MATTEVSKEVSKRYNPFIPLTTIRTVVSNIVRGVQEKEVARSEKYKAPVFISADPMAYIPNVVRQFWHPEEIGLTVIQPKDNFDPNKLPKNGYLLRGFEEYINGRSESILMVSYETLVTPTGEILLHYEENGSQVFKSFNKLSDELNIFLSNSKRDSDLEHFAIKFRREVKDVFREPRYLVIDKNRTRAAEYREKRLQRNIASTLTRFAGNLKMLTKAYLELEEDDKTGLRVLANNSVLDWFIDTGVLSSANRMESWIGDKFVLDSRTGFAFKSTLLSSTYGNKLYSPFCKFTYKNGTEGFEANPWDKKRYLIIKDGITRKELKKMSERHLGTYRRKLLKKVMLRGFKPGNDDQSKWEDLDESSQE